MMYVNNYMHTNCIYVDECIYLYSVSGRDLPRDVKILKVYP